jgi:O-antigen/teichoic acid export membrane protein
MIDIAVQIGFNLDNLVIGGAIGTAAVAVYSVTLRLADYQRQLGNQFNSLLFPVIVRFRSAGQAEALQETLIEGTRIALALMVGVTICLVGFARPLILIWMGPDFEGSIAPLYVLAVTGVVLVGQGPLANVLLGTGRHRLVAFSSLSEALANLVLSLLLVRRFGIVGVAAGTAIPVIAANACVLLPAACRAVSLSVSRFLRIVAGPALVGAIPASLVCIALRVMAPPQSMAAVVGEGAVVGVVYCGSLFGAGLNPQIRARYAEHLRRLLPA